MTIEKLYEIYTQQANYKVTTDSRNVPRDAIFFALKGSKFDGNQFATDAIKKGASFAVIDNPKFYTSNNPKLILVKNALETLQKLANYHRKQLKIKVLALTGTAGKTTTKELIKAVLAQKFKTYATIGNLNNHIGVPLTLLSITPDYEFAVIEMGASQKGDIKLLCEIAEPDYGLITTIGIAHIEGFGSQQILIQTKAEIYKYLEQKNGIIFINSDNHLLTSLTNHKKLFSYATDPLAHTFGYFNEINPFLKFTFRTSNFDFLTVQTKLFGKYNLENALAAIAVGQFFQIPDQQIAEAIEKYEPKNNRSQIFKTKNNTLILDMYNANPTSMTKALESFAQIPADNKVLILGDMLELGDIAEQEHKKILNFAEQLGFKEIYLVGDIFSKVNDKYPQFSDSQKLKEYLTKNPLKNKFILLKASRAIKLETILDVL